MVTQLRSTNILVFWMGVVFSMSSLLAAGITDPSVKASVEAGLNFEIRGGAASSGLGMLMADGDFEPEDNGKPDEAPGAGTRCV